MNTTQKTKSILPVEVSLLRGGNVKSSWSIGTAAKPKFTVPKTLQPSQVLAMAAMAPTIDSSSVPHCSLCNDTKKSLLSSSPPNTELTASSTGGSSNFIAKIQKPLFSLGRSLDPWNIIQSTAPAHELFPPRTLKLVSAVIPIISTVKKIEEEKITVTVGISVSNSNNANAMGIRVGILSTATWGRLFWGMMHAQAYYYSIDPTEQERDLKLKWFESTIPTIPCPTCRHSAEEWCSINPLSAALQNQWTLTKWVRDFENDVRARTTRKPSWTPEQISAKYEFPTVPRQP